MRARRDREGPSGSAKDRALRLLAVRWRSREELRGRLHQAGFEWDEIFQALEDLEGAGLIEDERFAKELVRDQVRRRLAGDRVIRNALREKGIAADVAESAMEDVGDEAGRAAELAARRAVRMTGLDPQAAYRRLYSVLLRRGFGHAVSSTAARDALRLSEPDEGFAGGP